MSLLATVKEAVGVDGDNREPAEFRCTDCDTEFVSTTVPARAHCPECLGHEVEPTAGD